MKHLIMILATVVPAAAQVNFDSAGGDIPSLLAKASAGPEVSAPQRVQEGGPCEAFSAESSMASIPVYDQQLEGTPDSDTGICYAVTAAHMFDHWSLTRGGGGSELVSPLMLDAAARARSGRGGQGGELTAETLYSMSREDVCTLGVAAGSRGSLSVAEELDLVERARGGKGGSSGKDDSAGGESGQGGAEVPGKGSGQGGSSLRERFEALGSGSGREACRPVTAQRFNAIYQRTRQVQDAAGGRRGVPFTTEDLRGFFARNTASQPVAVKFNYEEILGDPSRAAQAAPHWALVVARRQSGDRCEYLVRNSMGADTPTRWVEESRLAASVRSMAVLVP